MKTQTPASNKETKEKSQKFLNFRSGRVAIIGRPNAGKSTLLNSLLEISVSATSDRPQTTRTNITGVVQLHDKKKNWVGQIVLVDTPGLNFKKGLLDRSMFMSIEEALSEVDTLVWVADWKTFKNDIRDIELKRPGSDKIAGWLKDRLDKTHGEKRWILALNKVDKAPKGELLPLISRAHEILPEFSEIIPISALQGLGKPESNLESLLEVIRQKLPFTEPFYDEGQWTDLTEKQLIQNLLREAIFRQCKQEVPYQADSSIVRFLDPQGRRKMPEVDATIWVAKDSLKPILVGHAGARIRDIGVATRERYKEITGDDLVLRLLVKVVEKWESRPPCLAELGYGAVANA